MVRTYMGLELSRRTKAVSRLTSAILLLYASSDLSLHFAAWTEWLAPGNSTNIVVHLRGLSPRPSLPQTWASTRERPPRGAILMPRPLAEVDYWSQP